MLWQETYIGIDVHKETLQACAMGKEGKVLFDGHIPNSKEAIREFLKEIPVWNTQIGIEACGIWRGVYKNLISLGYKVRIAHPKKTHQIAGCKKTDKVDSKILADLLRTKYFPDVYIPDDRILGLRDLSRHKTNLTRIRVKVQNKIKGYLLREGITYDKSIWNERGIKWLRSLNNEKLNDLIETYCGLREREKNCMNSISAKCRNIKETALLTTIPGVGDFGATLIYAEIGDIRRFNSPKELHAYAGLAPGINQSANKEKSVRRKDINKWLKWIAGECTGRSLLIKSKLQSYYFKKKKKKGWKTAKKATSRKMLSIIYYMLRDLQPYHDPSFAGKDSGARATLIV